MRIEDIIFEVKRDKRWILKVINSCESEGQLKCCYNIIKLWSLRTKKKIENYNCPFYKYKEIKKIQSIYRSLEFYLYREVDKRIIER